MIAGKHDFGPVTGLIELLHVSSQSEYREEIGLDRRSKQTQLQAELRTRW